MTTPTYPDARMNPVTLMEKTHPAIMDMPMLGEADLRALTASIQNNGVMKPISLSHDGQVIDGRNRIAAAVRAGLISVPVIYLGSEVDPLSYALESAVTGRNLTRSGIVLMLYLKHPDLVAMRADRKGGRPSEEKGQITVDNYQRFPGKGSESFASISEKYNVPAEYFTRLAHIHEQVDEDTWEKVKRSILDRESSISAMVAGIAGKESSKTRKDPSYHRLTCTIAVTMENAFKNWGKIAWNEKYSRETAVTSFGQALLVAPDEIRVIEGEVIMTHWTDHEREQLYKQLKKKVEAEKKAKKAKKTHKGV